MSCGISVVRAISYRAQETGGFDLKAQRVSRDHKANTYGWAIVDGYMRVMGVWKQQNDLQEGIFHLDLIGNRASLAIGKESGRRSALSNNN